MILLDTHVWLWMLHNPSNLSETATRAISEQEEEMGLLVSVISVWEIAVKASMGKLILPLPLVQWYEQAKTYPGLIVEPLHPLDAISSTQLPGEFHKDPADRILVALARRYDISLVTCDRKILNYPYVKTIA